MNNFSEGNYELSFEEEEILDDYRNANYKLLNIPISIGGTEIINLQLPQDFNLGKGGIFWDAVRNDERKLVFLELGAGTAFPGILLGALGYKTLITDIGPILKLAQRSIELNAHHFPDPMLVSSKELFWGNKEQISVVMDEEMKFDYIICADLLYLPDTFGDLIETLKRVCSTETKILMSYRIRLPEMIEDFFSMFEEHFVYENVNEELISLIHPNPKEKFIIGKLR